MIESVIFNEFLNSKTLLSILENPDNLKQQVEKELKTLEQQLENSKSEKESKLDELSRLAELYISGGERMIEIVKNKETTINKELDSIEDKLKLINKEIFNKKRILLNYDEEKASTEMLLKAKENRHELYAIYKQLIHKVVINEINSKYTCQFS